MGKSKFKEDTLLTLPLVAELLQIPYPTLAEWAREGIIKAEKMKGIWHTTLAAVKSSMATRKYQHRMRECKASSP